MSIRGLAILAADAIFSFSRFPIRICLGLGTIGTLVFMAAGIYVIIAKGKRFCSARMVFHPSQHIFSWFHSACISLAYWANMSTEAIRNPRIVLSIL